MEKELRSHVSSCCDSLHTWHCGLNTTYPLPTRLCAECGLWLVPWNVGPSVGFEGHNLASLRARMLASWSTRAMSPARSHSSCHAHDIPTAMTFLPWWMAAPELRARTHLSSLIVSDGHLAEHDQYSREGERQQRRVRKDNGGVGRWLSGSPLIALAELCPYNQ